MTKNTDKLKVNLVLSPSHQKLQGELELEHEQAGLVIAAKTSEIKQLLRRTASDIQQIGLALLTLKNLLPQGSFSQWVAREFEWSERQAQRFMQVARAFGEVELAGLPIMPSALYLLSAPHVSETIREEAIRRASLGEEVSFNLARELVASPLYFDQGSVVEGAIVVTAHPEAGQSIGGGEAASWDFHEELTSSFLPEDNGSDVTPEPKLEVGLGTTQATIANFGNNQPEFRTPPYSHLQPGAITSKRAAYYPSGSFNQSLEVASDEVLGLEFIPPSSQADTFGVWEGLGLAASDKAALAGLGLSEVALLSISKLEAADREQVARLLLEHPEISGKKLRRLLSQLRQGEPFLEARDEALGWVNGKPVYASARPVPPELTPLSAEQRFSIISQNLLTSAGCIKAALAQLDALLSISTGAEAGPMSAPTQPESELEWVTILANLAESNLVEQLKIILVTRLLSKSGTPQQAEALAARPAKWSEPVLQASLTRFLQTF